MAFSLSIPRVYLPLDSEAMTAWRRQRRRNASIHPTPSNKVPHPMRARCACARPGTPEEPGHGAMHTSLGCAIWPCEGGGVPAAASLQGDAIASAPGSAQLQGCGSRSFARARADNLPFSPTGPHKISWGAQRSAAVCGGEARMESFA